jgi:hypothetical protein
MPLIGINMLATIAAIVAISTETTPDVSHRNFRFALPRLALLITTSAPQANYTREASSLTTGAIARIDTLNVKLFTEFHHRQPV